MDAKICDRCGAIWKDAKNEEDCGVYVYKITIIYEYESFTDHCDLCKDCIKGLSDYLNNKKNGK